MQIKLMVFGPLKEITGWNEQSYQNIADTIGLMEKLELDFPNLKNMEYRIAVNHHIIDQKTTLQDRDEVALLPPFSGG